MFKNFILLICLVYIFFAVYILLAYLNVHNLIFLSIVHEYAYKTFYEYISKLANYGWYKVFSTKNWRRWFVYIESIELPKFGVFWNRVHLFFCFSFLLKTAIDRSDQVCGSDYRHFKQGRSETNSNITRSGVFAPSGFLGVFTTSLNGIFEIARFSKLYFVLH